MDSTHGSRHEVPAGADFPWPAALFRGLCVGRRTPEDAAAAEDPARPATQPRFPLGAGSHRSVGVGHHGVALGAAPSEAEAEALGGSRRAWANAPWGYSIEGASVPAIGLPRSWVRVRRM